MTNRERILNTLQCKPADRAPFGIGIGFSPWGETLKRWKVESGIADLNIRTYFGFDLDFMTLPLEYGAFPGFETRVIGEDAEFRTSIDYRGLTVRNRIDGGSIPEFIDNPVKSREDWKRYKDERLQQHLEGRLSKLDDFIKRTASTDAPVQIGQYPWGVFGTPRDLLGTEEFLVKFYTEPDLVRDVMETLTDLWLAVYKAAAKRVRIDHIHIWEDMSYKNGPLISPAMTEEFMMPCYDRITAFARKAGTPIVSVDTDGKVDTLIPVFLRHGINMMLPFEVQAGNDLRGYKREYPELAIMGGLDKNALADYAAPEAMHHELDKCADLLALGGYLPGLDHLVPPDVSWKKWCLFVHELRILVQG